MKKIVRTTLSVWVSIPELKAIRDSAVAHGVTANAWALFWLSDQALPLHQKFQGGVGPEVGNDYGTQAAVVGKQHHLSIAMHPATLDMIRAHVERKGIQSIQTWARRVLAWATTTEIHQFTERAASLRGDSVIEAVLTESKRMQAELEPIESPITPHIIPDKEISVTIILPRSVVALTYPQIVKDTALGLDVATLDIDRTRRGAERVLGAANPEPKEQLQIPLTTAQLAIIEPVAETLGLTVPQWLEAIALSLLTQDTKG